MIYSNGAIVTMQDCAFDSNGVNSGTGGTIYQNGGSLTLDSTSIRGGVGKFGAGIYSNVPIIARNCTFEGSGSSLAGAQGGAMYLTAGGTIWNSTIAYNGFINNNGTGGGIFGNVTLESTIVSNNSALSAPDISGAVTAKNCALGTSSGFSSFTDQGGNLAFGTNLQFLNTISAPYGGQIVYSLPILPTSPCKNAGSNPAGLLYDVRGPGFPRSVFGTPDIGSYEITPPPKVTVQLNDGSAQRSRVTQFNVTFDHPNIYWSSGVENSFQLRRTSDNANVTFAPLNSTTSLNLLTVRYTFSAGPLNNGSLADGVYVLTEFASQITDELGQHLDGNGDGVGGDDYVSPTTAGNPNRIFRLFGDADGSGTVDALDFGMFIGAFGTGTGIFDFDNGGTTDALDFGQFLQRFGTGI